MLRVADCVCGIPPPTTVGRKSGTEKGSVLTFDTKAKASRTARPHCSNCSPARETIGSCRKPVFLASPAEKLFERSLRGVLATRGRRRQAADDNRLAACAPQNSRDAAATH